MTCLAGSLPVNGSVTTEEATSLFTSELKAKGTQQIALFTYYVLAPPDRH